MYFRRIAGIIGGFVILATASHCIAQEDAVARQALIGALTEDDNGMRQAWESSQNANAQNATGISRADAINYLYNCTRKNREDFLAGQEILAASTKNKDWRNRVLLSLLTDEVYEMNRLEGQNRFNKYTRIFNRVSTSLSQLVLLQPQAAASLVWDGIYSFRKTKSATIKERKIVFLCDQFLKKYPSAPERADVIQLRQELKQKMISDRIKSLVSAGRSAMSEGKFETAEWQLEKASLMDPKDADISQLLTEARTLKVRSEEIRGLTLGVSDAERRLPPEQVEAIGDIARAMIKGDVKTLNGLRQNVAYVWDSVDYGYAAISENQGDHAAALTRLQNLSVAAPTSPGGRAAIKLLDNPNFNLNESYQTALAEMSSEKTKFIWTGRRTKEDTVYSAGSATISSAGNPVAVPVLFGMDAAVRAISEKFKTQVSVDGVLDAGARYLRKYPETPRSKEIAMELAKLAKKSGDYDRSMEYLEEGGGGSADDVAKLKENQAIAIYDQMKRSGDLLEKRRLLKQLVDEYPNAKITKKNAAKEQAKLPPALADDTLVLPGSALGRDQRLAQYLGVPAYLVDGSKGNGEVSDEGVAITPSANVVEFQIRKESGWRRGVLVEQGRDWILTSSRQLRNEFMQTEEGRQLLFRQRMPFAVDGGVGSGGVDMAPQIIPYSTSEQDKKRFN